MQLCPRILRLPVGLWGRGRKKITHPPNPLTNGSVSQGWCGMPESVLEHRHDRAFTRLAAEIDTTVLNALRGQQS
jgi:hypothetical protein